MLRQFAGREIVGILGGFEDHRQQSSAAWIQARLRFGEARFERRPPTGLHATHHLRMCSVGVCHFRPMSLARPANEVLRSFVQRLLHHVKIFQYLLHGPGELRYHGAALIAAFSVAICCGITVVFGGTETGRG